MALMNIHRRRRFRKKALQAEKPSRKIPFTQINTRKCKNSMDHFNIEMSKKGPFILLGQEPYCGNKNKVLGLDKRHVYICPQGPIYLF